MCGGSIGSAFDGLTNAVTGVVSGAFNVLKAAAIPQAPDPGQPGAPGTPPSSSGSAAPSQAAQRPQNSAGSLSPGSAGSTLLTGGQGVAPSMLTLGRNTLLGQ